MARTAATNRIAATNRTAATRTGLVQNYTINEGTLFEGFGTIGDWTPSPASPGTLAISTDGYNSTDALAVTSANSANNKQAIKTISKSFADSGYVFTFMVKPDNYTDTVVLGFSSATSFATVYMNYAINTTTMQKNKWNLIRVPKSAFTAVGGESWANTMIRMRFRNVSNSAELPSTALFDDLRYNKVIRPKIILQSDNVGSLSTINTMYPILDTAGLKATLFVQSNLIGGVNKLTLANLQTLYGAGWDLGNHTTDHSDLTAITVSEAQGKVQDCTSYLLSNGFSRAAYHLSYPLGATNAAVNTMLETIGMKTGRKATDRTQVVPVADYFTLDAYTIKAADAVATVTGYVDTAIERGTTAILMTEGLADSDPAEQEWLTSNYQSLIDYIIVKKNQGLLDVVTISEWYNGLSGKRKSV